MTAANSSMYNAKHLTGEDVERAWGEFKGSVLGMAEAVCGRGRYMYMDNIVREARQKFVWGVQMEETVVQLLLFADDLMLMAENAEDAERNLRVLDEVMGKWKMRINWRKTKALTVKRGGGTCDISVKGEKIAEVKTMKYLGALFNEEGSCEEEIENRIGAASKVIGAMRTEVLHGEKRAEQGNKAESV